MKIKNNFSSLILIFLNFKFFYSNECLIFDLYTGYCKICSYDSYPANYFINSFIGTSQGCILKNLTFSYRKILIINDNLYLLNSEALEFDAIYTDMFEAFVNETLIAMKYCHSNITMILSKETHNLSIFNYSSCFFERIQCNIYVKPLYCVEYPILSYCIQNSRAKVYFEYIPFCLFITGVVIIENIDFYGNSNFFDYNCFSQNYDFFQIELSFDDPNFIIPIFSLQNSSFFNVFSGSFIKISALGGQILLSHILFENSYFKEDFLYYDNNTFILENINIISGFDRYIKTIIDDNIPSLFKVNINDVIISNTVIIGNPSNLSIFMNLYSFPGEIILNNVKFDNFSALNNFSSNFLIYISYSNDSIIFNDIFFSNINNFIVLSIESSNLNFSNISLINSLYSSPGISFIGCHNISINTLIIINLYSNQKKEDLLIFIKYCIIEIIHSLFKSVDGFGMSSTDSNLNIFETYFTNLTLNQWEITLVNTMLILENAIFANLQNFSYLLFYMNCEKAILKGCFLQNISNSLALLSGNNIKSLILDGVSLENIFEINYFVSNGLNLDTLIISNSTFLNIVLNKGFLFFVQEISLILINTKLINITLIAINSIFIKTSSGDTIIDSCFLSNIVFFLYLFNLEGGTSAVNNTLFRNIGLNLVIDPSKLANIGYVSLFYMWSLQSFIFFNSSFHNLGNISLFSGFIESSLIKDETIISFCTFEYSNKTVGYYYHGVILGDTPRVLLNDNIFKGVECSNYNSILHRNGILLILGADFFAFNFNNKNLSMCRNIFINCKCLNGGSLGIVNYNRITINNTYVTNSYAYNKGGAFFLISSSYLSISKVFVENAESYEASIVYLENIVNCEISDSRLTYAFSNKSGCISTKNTQNLILFNNTLSYSMSFSKGGALFLKEGDVLITNCSFFNVLSYDDGGVIYIYYSNFNINNAISYLNSAKYGGFLFLDNCYVVNITNIELFNISSKYNGGAIYSNNVAFLMVKSILFKMIHSEMNGIFCLNNNENSAIYEFDEIKCIDNSASMGSCIYSESLAIFKIRDLICQNNTNNILTFQWIYPINVFLRNITFKENKVKDNLLYVSGVNMRIENIKFINNYIESKKFIYIFLDVGCELEINIINLKYDINANFNYFQIFSAIESNITIKNITIFPGNFSYNFLQGEYIFVSLENSIFLNNFNNLIIVEKSELNLTNITFISNSGSILTLYDTNCYIINSFFLNNTHDSEYNVSCIMSNIKYTDKTKNLIIINSIFEDFEGISIYISNLNSIYVKNCSFTGKNTSRGIQISSINFISIILCNFSVFLGDKGSALILNNDMKNQRDFTYINISESLFYDNKAYYGGVMFLEGNLIIYIKNSIFSRNTAFNKTINEKKYGVGGVMIMKCVDQLKCDIHIENCKFFNNFAESCIPTIFSTAYLNVNNLLFLNNENSNIYNLQTMTSFPVSINLLSVDNIMNEKYFEIVSGVSFNMTLVILDQFNQTIIQITPISSNFIQKSSINESKIFIKNSDSLSSKIGKISFQNLIIETNPASFFTIEFTIKLYDFDSITPYIFKKDIIFYARSCQIGEIYSYADNICVKCGPKTYSFIDPMKDTTYSQACKKCENNAICPGKNYLIPNPGFWRYSNDSIVMDTCMLDFACIGINEDLSESDIGSLLETNASYFINVDLIHGTCLIGHYGHLCYDCIMGYGKMTSLGQCESCNMNLIYVVARLIICAMFLVFYLIFNAKLLANSDSQTIDVVSKVCINHIQKINFVVFFNITVLLNDLQRFFSFLNIFSFINEDIFSNDCHLQYILQSAENLYVYKVIISWCLPFITTFLCFVIFKFYYCANYLFGRNKSHLLSNKFILIFLISIFIFYPLITKSSMTMMNCIKLNESIEFLFLSPNLECWVGVHLAYFFIFGVVGILVWGICFPIFLFYSLKKNSALLPERSEFNAKRLGNKYIDFLKFFHKDYKNDYYFWECVIFFQKFLLCILVNLSHFFGQEIETILFLQILLIYFYFFLEAMPFKLKEINYLEILSIFIAIGTKMIVYASQFFQQIYQIQLFFTIVILLSNCVFFILSGILIIKFTKWKELYENFIKKVSSISNRIIRPSNKIFINLNKDKFDELTKTDLITNKILKSLN